MSSLVNQVSSSSMFEEEKAFGYALCLRFSNMFSYVLDAAIQLGIFAILAKASPDAHLSSYEIASQLHTTNNFSSYDPQLPHANLNPASHRLMRPCNSRLTTWKSAASSLGQVSTLLLVAASFLQPSPSTPIVRRHMQR